MYMPNEHTQGEDMGFTEEVDEWASRPPSTNKIPWIVMQMGDEGAELLAAFVNPSVPPAAIAEALHKRGYEISAKAIQTRCAKDRRQRSVNDSQGK